MISRCITPSFLSPDLNFHLRLTFVFTLAFLIHHVQLPINVLEYSSLADCVATYNVDKQFGQL